MIFPHLYKNFHKIYKLIWYQKEFEEVCCSKIILLELFWQRHVSAIRSSSSTRARRARAPRRRCSPDRGRRAIAVHCSHSARATGPASPSRALSRGVKRPSSSLSRPFSPVEHHRLAVAAAELRRSLAPPSSHAFVAPATAISSASTAAKLVRASHSSSRRP